MLATAATCLFLAMPVSAPGVTPVTPPAPTFVGPEQPAETVERGYGLEILAADGLGLAVLVAGGAMESEEVSGAGGLTLWFAPAIVHATHGRFGAAVTSAVMRPALVYGGAALGFATASCSDSDNDEIFCGLGQAALGGVIGYGAAVVIDAAYLAREKRTPGPRTWAPSVAASPAGVRVGIGGTF